ncbi:universal stress protein [Pseudonocardia bannensis]|uniref:Universal stress protein n=1 Tax=Pseudonocardia bannensis TaxID=630973 RepID=A0A848DKU0_9PSEU|nr:universal stress protein [Pseudonocardia bannensis]NMH93081.1 universal stress protein [Pseudonocardia bannensis]
MSGIVVGVDRSEHALDALRWAIEEAAYRGCPLRVVYVWEPHYVYEDCRGDIAMALGVESGRRESTLPEELLQVVLGDRDRPPGLETTSREGHPGKVLTELAADADMLVVGSLGRGARRRHLVSGSVAHYVANHARCPVTVVPPARTYVLTT